MSEASDHLHQYTANGSEDAIAAVVQSYLPLVCAAALRRLGGDVHRAHDVAQLVFTALARNAAALAKHPELTGWLFTTTRSWPRKRSVANDAGRRGSRPLPSIPMSSARHRGARRAARCGYAPETGRA